MMTELEASSYDITDIDNIIATFEAPAQQSYFDFTYIDKIIETFDLERYPNVKDIHRLLWTKLEYCRHLPPAERSEWKYDKDLNIVETMHSDGQKVFEKMSWEESYAFCFIWSIRH